jgi:hypothetical protein
MQTKSCPQKSEIVEWACCTNVLIAFCLKVFISFHTKSMCPIFFLADGCLYFQLFSRKYFFSQNLFIPLNLTFNRKPATTTVFKKLWFLSSLLQPWKERTP